MILSLFNVVSDPCNTAQFNAAGVASGTQVEYYDLDEGTAPYPDCKTGIGPTNAAFAKTMLADLRSTYAAPPYRACGLTNVRVHRVNYVGNAGSVPSALARAAFRVQHY
jgi:hypothetical protein